MLGRDARRRFVLVAVLALAACAAPPRSSRTGPLASASRVAPPRPTDERTRWKETASRVRITRDDWGIAHVVGPTDADAVFGMIYAQAEDDFPRIETNYLNALGRLAEAEGEKAIIQDLRMKLFIDPDDLKRRYDTSPAWLKSLMNAWADGLDFFLATHDAKPRVLTRFEPWMALAFTEGSIGGDIERIALRDLEAFYDAKSDAPRTSNAPRFEEPSGSNGIAIAPAKTANGHALLLINPHTSFFFRSELHVTSGEGLDAYGAATWGQFFIYQGFNAHAGWMHTSTGVDVVDEYAETVTWKDGRPFYKSGSEERSVIVSTITVPFKRESGELGQKSFTVYRTHHGPIVRAPKGRDGAWISVALMHKPVEALTQSFLRTKVRDLDAFMAVGELGANSSNNTIFADDKGGIAHLLPQFVPKRDDQFDFTRPVDGADPRTDWQGLHRASELPGVVRPASGWVMNTNNWPYSAAGSSSPKREPFPRYVDTAGENARGVHATSLLANANGMTLESLVKAAYDPYLPAFARLVPLLVDAYDRARDRDVRAKLAEPMAVLRSWDFAWSTESIATSLAVFWGEALVKEAARDLDAERAKIADGYEHLATRTTPAQKLQALVRACARLHDDFGTWRTPWGEINRYQRINGDLVQPFSDARPSTPIPFTSGQWGSLASFGARAYEGTRRYYGTSGNSFVAAVEFGDRVRAVAVSVGGASGHAASRHFDDQVARYARGELRAVYFHPDERKGHIEREYHPGE